MDALLLALAVALVALAVNNVLLYREMKMWRERAEQWAALYYNGGGWVEVPVEEAGDAERNSPANTALPKTEGEVAFQEAEGGRQDCPDECIKLYERYVRGEIKQNTLRDYYRRHNCPKSCPRPR